MQAYDLQLYGTLPLTGETFVDEMCVDSRFLYEAWKKLSRDVITVEVDDEIFGEYYEIVVLDEDITDLLKLSALGNSASELYIW